MKRLARGTFLRSAVGAIGGLALWPLARASGASAAMGGMTSSGDGDMRTVMTLFARHDAIHRVVEPVPGGIRAVTQSADPEVAALLKAHVASMYARVKAGRTFTMMSRTLPALFERADRYERRAIFTATGVSVVETSTDPETVKLIREHGVEVSGFVTDGMRGMCPMSSMMQ